MTGSQRIKAFHVLFLLLAIPEAFAETSAAYSGSLLWTSKNAQTVINPDQPFACTCGGKCSSCVVVASGGDPNSGATGFLSAVDVLTGAVAWTYRGDLNVLNVVFVPADTTGSENSNSLLVCTSTSKCGSNACSWTALCISQASGQLVWQSPGNKLHDSGSLPTLLVPPNGLCSGQTQAAGVMVVDVNVGHVSCLAAANGSSIWSVTTGSDGSILSVVPLWQRVPEVGRSWLLVQTYSNYAPFKGSPSVQAFDVGAQGALVWRQGSDVVPDAGLSTCELLLVSSATSAYTLDSLMVIPEGYNKIVALLVANGTAAWSVASGGWHDDLVVQGGLVKGIDPIDGNNNRIRAWQVSDGQMAWQYPDSSVADANPSLFIWSWGQAPAAASAAVDTVAGPVFVYTSKWFALDSGDGHLLYDVANPPGSANLQLPPLSYQQSDDDALYLFAANSGVVGYNASSGVQAWWSTRMLVGTGSAMMLSQNVPGLLVVGDSDVSFPAIVGVDAMSGSQDFTVTLSDSAAGRRRRGDTRRGADEAKATADDNESWTILPLGECIASGSGQSQQVVAFVSGAYTSGTPPYEGTQTFVYAVAIGGSADA